MSSEQQVSWKLVGRLLPSPRPPRAARSGSLSSAPPRPLLTYAARRDNSLPIKLLLHAMILETFCEMSSIKFIQASLGEFFYFIDVHTQSFCNSNSGDFLILSTRYFCGWFCLTDILKKKNNNVSFHIAVIFSFKDNLSYVYFNTIYLPRENLLPYTLTNNFGYIYGHKKLQTYYMSAPFVSLYNNAILSICSLSCRIWLLFARRFYLFLL